MLGQRRRRWAIIQISEISMRIVNIGLAALGLAFLTLGTLPAEAG